MAHTLNSFLVGESFEDFEADFMQREEARREIENEKKRILNDKQFYKHRAIFRNSINKLKRHIGMKPIPLHMDKGQLEL